jgi:septal ring factor EnvC (AmiA/AmiB activator)
MPQLNDEHKRHLVLWASVGGTAAVIVALWAFVLPHQLARFSAESSDDGSLSRWMTERKSGTSGDSSQSFSELLQKQRERLNAVARNQIETGNTNANNGINIEDLRAKINSGLNANAATDTNLPAGQAGSATKPNDNAPAKP